LSDIVVPTSELPATLKEVKESMESFAIRAAIFGHIGDGNIHANIFVDLSSKEKVESVERFQKELGMISLKHAGSVSAEHGIGMEKKDLLKEEFRLKNSPGTMELMKSIKTTIDPKNLLNRGKIFDV
ncbi:MAG: dehydrogenase, partial [Candidatus Thermoplasmatota archaeon]|nr:dehydrogenase [Candidatus Thermoplasmatota archaeon]